MSITLDPSFGIIDDSTVEGTVIPVGITSERPDNASRGTIRINTDISSVNVIEMFDGSRWIIVSRVEN